MTALFKLTKFNNTTLGRMGDTQGVHWEKYFIELINAQAYAVADNKAKFKWSRSGSKHWQSPDLLSHQYEIDQIRTED